MMKIFQTKEPLKNINYDYYGDINRDDYKLVYEDTDDRFKGYGLEDLFCAFNKWEDKEGLPIAVSGMFSMSVGDVVELDGKFYICAPIGFNDITEIFKRQGKPYSLYSPLVNFTKMILW